MTWLLLLVGTVLVVEAFLRLPVKARLTDFRELIARIVRVIASDSISDHWKEKTLPVYAGRLFTGSLALFALCLLALLPMALVALLGETVNLPVSALLASWSGIAASTAIAVVYALARTKIAGG